VRGCIDGHKQRTHHGAVPTRLVHGVQVRASRQQRLHAVAAGACGQEQRREAVRLARLRGGARGAQRRNARRRAGARGAVQRRAPTLRARERAKQTKHAQCRDAIAIMMVPHACACLVPGFCVRAVGQQRGHALHGAVEGGGVQRRLQVHLRMGAQRGAQAHAHACVRQSGRRQKRRTCAHLTPDAPLRPRSRPRRAAAAAPAPPRGRGRRRGRAAWCRASRRGSRCASETADDAARSARRPRRRAWTPQAAQCRGSSTRPWQGRERVRHRPVLLSPHADATPTRITCVCVCGACAARWRRRGCAAHGLGCATPAAPAGARTWRCRSLLSCARRSPPAATSGTHRRRQSVSERALTTHHVRTNGGTEPRSAASQRSAARAWCGVCARARPRRQRAQNACGLVRCQTHARAPA
jgi:hypothetical protein